MSSRRLADSMGRRARDQPGFPQAPGQADRRRRSRHGAAHARDPDRGTPAGAANGSDRGQAGRHSGLRLPGSAAAARRPEARDRAVDRAARRPGQPLPDRRAVRRVAAVVAGVLLAVGLSAWVGFTWWSLGITVVLALAVGYALHLGDAILEVPVSAMLILSVAGPGKAATGRIIETLVGAGAGLAAGFILGPPRVH